MKKVTVAKFELAFTRCRNNLEMIGNLTVKNSLQDLDAKEMYLHSKNRSVAFQKHRKMFCFHHFRVFTRCFFQDLLVIAPFSKSTVFKICRQKMSRFRVNWRPIRPIFHRFQNVPASCKRCLNLTYRLQKLIIGSSMFIEKLCWMYKFLKLLFNFLKISKNNTKFS